MKQGFQRFCYLLLSLALFCRSAPGTRPLPQPTARENEFRAVWVSTVLNLDYPAAPVQDAAELSRQADGILDGAASMGFNAVILQVRPRRTPFIRRTSSPGPIT